MTLASDVELKPGQIGVGSLYGVLDLDLGAAVRIVEIVRAGEGATVICRRITWLARQYLQARLGAQLALRLLARDPYNLPAQDLCDERQRNFRCDAIESVIAVARLIVSDLSGELVATTEAADIREADDIFRRFMRHQAGEMVRDQVYLAYHLISRWRSNRDSRTVLLLPKCWWATYITAALKGTGLDIGSVPAKSVLATTVSLIARRLKWSSKPAKAEFEVGSHQSGQEEIQGNPDEWLSSRQTKWNGVRASAISFDGMDPMSRNNFGWAWRSALPLDALVAFWAVKSRPINAWERRVCELGVHIVSMLPRKSNQLPCGSEFKRPRRHQWIFRQTTKFMYLLISRPQVLLTAKARWLLTNIAVLLARSIEWRSVFSKMNVRVHVEFDYGLDAYARALAIRELGGVIVLDQRSEYFDNYDHTSDRPGDLALLSGPSSVRYYSPRLFEVGHIVMTGLSRDGRDAGQPAAILQTMLTKPIVALLDEPGTIYGPEHAIKFVSSVIEHCSRNGGYKLVLKLKRKDELLGKLSSFVSSTLHQLIAEGRAHIFASSTPVATVCEACNIIVSVPSTAAYIAIGVGKPVLVFNPFNTIRTVFYEHDLGGSHIFVDLELMLARLDTMLANREFGAKALERTRKVLDPWLDMKGNERKGYFVTQLVQHLSGGFAKSEAIAKSMSDYRGRYGESTCGGWKSVWDGASSYAGDLATTPPRFDRIDLETRAMT